MGASLILTSLINELVTMTKETLFRDIYGIESPCDNTLLLFSLKSVC